MSIRDAKLDYIAISLLHCCNTPHTTERYSIGVSPLCKCVSFKCLLCAEYVTQLLVSTMFLKLVSQFKMKVEFQYMSGIRFRGLLLLFRETEQTSWPTPSVFFKEEDVFCNIFHRLMKKLRNYCSFDACHHDLPQKHRCPAMEGLKF